MKHLLVISPIKGEESAQYLADLLGSSYLNPYKEKQYGFYKHKYVFNYGCSIKTGGTAKKINKASSVLLVMSKIKCIKLLEDSIKCVKLTEDKNTARDWIKEGHIVVARDTEVGDNGDGLVYCETQEDLRKQEEALFFTKYLEHTHEFRVNIWKGKVISVYNKINNGEHFIFKLFRGVENHPQLVHIAKTIYEKTKIDWCGVDLLRDEAGDLYFLEANSAPILFPYTANKLVQILRKEYK